MYTIKGFAGYATLANNTPGILNPIGEISTYSLTFTTEKGIYTNNTIDPHLAAITFTEMQDGTQIAMDVPTQTRTLTILAWIYNYCFTHGGQIYIDELLNALIAQFASTASNFNAGSTVITDGKYWAPEWVSWSDNAIASSTIKFWFGDDSFRHKFDDYNIVVVPPITPIDQFMTLNGQDVDALIKTLTVTEMQDSIQAAKNGNPETITRTYTFNYVDPANSSHLVPTNWSVLIYGPMGDNIDSIKDALVDYIMANTAYTKAQWTAIFPDIFKRTEFIILPRWDQYAIPNRVIEAGIYSPIMNLVEMRSSMTPFASDYPSAHIDAHMGAMGHYYKSLAVGMIGSIENKDNLYELQQVYPDYISVNTESTDFNRMSADTRGFSLMLYNGIIAAEAASTYSDVPVGMTKVTRNNMLFVVQTYDNIHWLVAAKSNFPAQT